MKKFNIAELLKDCPKGMELDCMMCDNLSYDYIDKEQNRIYCKVDLRDTVWFTVNGCVNLSPSAKCVIFPKGKTTWDGFVPPYEFKDGDIVTTANGIWIGIVKKPFKCAYETYITIYDDIEVYNNCILCFDRLATEEEKQKLFDVIKANGYKWNPGTKTLEKLPKFKVGDRVTNGKISITIGYLTDNEYYDEIGRNISNMLSIKNQDNWKLVHSKFDITTLVPFDKVLVRDANEREWIISFFSHRNGLELYKYSCINGSGYAQCIPYEGNEHLLGKTDDCDEFYKTWE